MIKGMHGIVFTPEAEEARAFTKDKLGFDHVDAGDGWLIFDVPKAEFAFHPGTDTHHEISFWCDDIEATMTELGAKGVEFKSPVQDQGFGLVTTFAMPGGAEVMLYEPKHPQP
jgi:catechol 2,3-dioxygenase-like lactoylglutathione lyase family enzyme